MASLVGTLLLLIIPALAVTWFFDDTFFEAYWALVRLAALCAAVYGFVVGLGVLVVRIWLATGDALERRRK